MKDLPLPSVVKNIGQFLRLASYCRRFIKDFAKMSKPLSDLTKPSVEFGCTEHCQKFFEILRENIFKEPILQSSDLQKEVFLTLEALHYAIGAILRQGEIGKDLPVAFASRILEPRELQYSTIEREF